jgi:hypothetical protein
VGLQGTHLDMQIIPTSYAGSMIRQGFGKLAAIIGNKKGKAIVDPALHMPKRLSASLNFEFLPQPCQTDQTGSQEPDRAGAGASSVMLLKQRSSHFLGWLAKNFIVKKSFII